MRSFTSFRMTGDVFRMTGDVFSMTGSVVTFVGLVVMSRMCAVVVSELSSGKCCNEYCKAYEHGDTLPSVVTRSFTSFRMT